MIIPCECGAKLKVDDIKIPERGVKVRCPRCGMVVTAQRTVVPRRESPGPRIGSHTASSAPLVLVAYESDVVRDMITSILVESNFRVDTASDGVDALKRALEGKPHALVLDVGLPGIYGFELCSRLKNNPHTGAIKIVLVSSVFDNRRYKRTPESLYGADDYIEKHHIHDLPVKLKKLLFPDQHPAEPPKHALPLHYGLPEMSRPPEREFTPSLLPVDNSQQAGRETAEHNPSASARKQRDVVPLTPESFSLEASIFQKDEYEMPQVEEVDPDAVEKAKRFARIIVSDIALYNQEAVARGIQDGTFFELLKNDIQEGRELYEKRVPSIIRRKKDYYKEAFDNFIIATGRKLRSSK